MIEINFIIIEFIHIHIIMRLFYLTLFTLRPIFQ